MFTITSFLLFGCIVLAFLCISVTTSADLNKKRSHFRWVYYMLMIMLGILGVFTSRNYIYPKNESIFNNADYHLLEHKGFKTDSTFYLVRGQYPNDYFPDMALWDSKSGVIKLTLDSIYVADYCEPFFVESKKTRRKEADSLSHHKGNMFSLVNNYIDHNITDEGLLLTKKTRTMIDTLYRLEIVPDGNTFLYISSGSGNEADTSSFTKAINRGYPLIEIISQSSKFDITEELQELLDGVFLVRKEIPISNEYGGEPTKRNESALVVFPGSNLFYADNILINSDSITNRSFSVPYSGNTLFYSGIGRTKSDVYCLAHDESNSLSIRFVLPKMQKLKKEGGRLFVSSSVESILADSKDGGYFYNIFDSETNFNHINGELRYKSGNALNDMKFEVMDVYSSNPSDKIHLYSNQEFELGVKAKGTNTKWIFEINDLRSSNPLKFNDICLFILLFLFLVGFRVLTDTFHEYHTLSFIELSSYVVVLSLCTVRLIIGWRASTFVPIEDITATVFFKMRKSVFQPTCLALILPLSFVILTACKSARGRNDSDMFFINKANDIFACIIQEIKSLICKIFNRFKKLFPSANHDVLVVFLLLMLFCYLCTRGPLERLFNIQVPLIIFLLFDLWLLKRERNTGNSVTLSRLILILLTFAYLFKKDAGFTIIFLTFLFIRHIVVGVIINGKDDKLFSTIFGDRRWKRWTKGSDIVIYTISFICTLILVLVLKNEGDLMIWAFNHVSYIIWGIGILLIVFSLSLQSRKAKITLWIVVALMTLVGFFEANPAPPNLISDRVNSKVHMKYRAEVQKLGNDERIDDLMEKCDFKSNDITFIMRSAHNQWFINQYLKAGTSFRPDSSRHKKKTYFRLQPHSNQGSTYPTQTTDLVITRYVIAEHGSKVVVLFMLMFLMLIHVYSLEVKIKYKGNIIGLSALILLTTIAMMVSLSATNRVVFIGQDFPFISLQSKVAVLFPMTLLFIAIYSVTKDRLSRLYFRDNDESLWRRKWAIPGSIFLICILAMILISPKGKNQNDRQFDVSQIIQELSEKTEILDRSFMKYQLATGKNHLAKDSLWREFTSDPDYSQVWTETVNDISESNRFYCSLLKYFDTRQTSKNNPEELLHMRKRNGYWHLAINKKHFFIPSMLEEELQWHGDLLAAKTERYFSFKTTTNEHEKRLTYKDDFDSNILPQVIQNKVENVSISKFDPSWGLTGEPMILINSFQAIGSKQFYNIEASDITIKGGASEHQIATLIKDGDLVMINKLDKNGEVQEVLGWRFGRDNENYLAKNIWMNGNRRLFYPLGKESMWSYQFANVVSSTLGKDDANRDSTLRISLDYDLIKQFYNILSSQNKTKLSLNISTLQQLQEFETLSYSDMQNIHNSTDFYYDSSIKRMKYKKRSSTEIEQALKRINDLIAKGDVDMDMEYRISDAIDIATERRFDFSAVAIDGNGRIRLLFDHTHSRNIDPNNIRYFNKFLSDLYRNGDNQSERDIFGNKALQILPSGPGSSFKPIAYTSITSQEKIEWESLDVLSDYRELAKSVPDPKLKSENTMYDYYGGVDVADLGQPLSIDGNSGLQHNNYLIYSNNLYHSTVILLGMQPHGQLEMVFKSAGTDKYAFPIMKYKGKRVSFDPNIWFPYNDLKISNGIMNDGLYNNFHLKGDLVNNSNLYANYYGQTGIFKDIFDNSSNYKTWTYPETGSQNVYDRSLAPKLRNGFNQMFLGAYPLEVSPLQMAIMGMRLATLNKTEFITTLDDFTEAPPEYEFFDVPTWSDDLDYLKFYQRQVLSQMRQVSLTGTARALSGVSNTLRRKGYYMYAKTGTLNDGRVNSGRNSRMKHLMVIISNKPLEQVASIEELKLVKYYVLYLSYIGINKDGFSTANFKKMIEAVTDSELFVKYMEE